MVAESHPDGQGAMEKVGVDEIGDGLPCRNTQALQPEASPFPKADPSLAWPVNGLAGPC